MRKWMLGLAFLSVPPLSGCDVGAAASSAMVAPGAEVRQASREEDFQADGIIDARSVTK